MTFTFLGSTWDMKVTIGDAGFPEIDLILPKSPCPIRRSGSFGSEHSVVIMDPMQLLHVLIYSFMGSATPQNNELMRAACLPTHIRAVTQPLENPSGIFKFAMSVTIHLLFRCIYANFT